jgi:hypothetical protein
MAKTTTPAASLMAAIQSMTTPDPVVKKARRLNTPNLGAKMLGTVRPKMLAAFKMDSWGGLTIV